MCVCVYVCAAYPRVWPLVTVSEERISLWRRNPGLQAKIKDAQQQASSLFFHWRNHVDDIARSMYSKVITPAMCERSYSSARAADARSIDR